MSEITKPRVAFEISGIGAALPHRRVDNHQLADMLAEHDQQTSDEWIVSRTGIKERPLADPERGETVAGLATLAGRNALTAAGVSPETINSVIVCTTTPDEMTPATATIVQHKLGLARAAAYDLNAACSGVAYGIRVAAGQLAMGDDNVLVIGADDIARITDFTDRNTAPLFSAGAGALLMEKSMGPSGLLGSAWMADGSLHDILYAPHGEAIKMQGKSVFRHAVNAVVSMVEASLEDARISKDEISRVIPHQANIRILEEAADRLGVPMEKFAVSIDHIGNSSAATIPITMSEMYEQGKLQRGEIVVLVGFGAGMTAASVVLRY